jgi:hypothetical protein
MVNLGHWAWILRTRQVLLLFRRRTVVVRGHLGLETKSTYEDIFFLGCISLLVVKMRHLVCFVKENVQSP